MQSSNGLAAIPAVLRYQMERRSEQLLALAPLMTTNADRQQCLIEAGFIRRLLSV